MKLYGRKIFIIPSFRPGFGVPGPGRRFASACGPKIRFSGPELEAVYLSDGSPLDAAVPGGRVVWTGSVTEMHYFSTDHLGSTRLVTDSDGNVLEQFDYLPYGQKCNNSTLAVANQYKTDYLYTGKELPEAFFGIDWYDSVARWQTTSGMFTSPDPLAELTPDYSPYAYASCNPLIFIDPVGLTTYTVDGEEWIIDDGYDDSVEVSESDFRRLQRRFRYSDSSYLRLRQRLMDKNGYVDSEGQYVLPASYSSADKSSSVFLPTIASVAALDLSIPDPTDFSLPKIGVEGIVFFAASAYSTQELLAKRDAEIAALMRRSPGPMGEQYVLRAEVDGFYLSYTYGVGRAYLRAGEVWKYGETIHGDTRYSNAWLEEHKLIKKTQAVGPQREMKKLEKIKIYKYYLRHRHLPPGNKIFR